jgi:hypothetical protein
MIMRLYIDPSAVSYVIPAIAGVAVVVGSWLFLHFRRAKSKVQKKLGIDENAGKEVEEDIVIKDEQTEEEIKDGQDKAD